MEFWGAEVKPGEAFKVDQLEVFGAYIHITQVALGEVAKKGKASEPVVLYLKVGEQKLVLGTLNRDEIPQISLDLVLASEFELSHSSKNAIVYFCGYREDQDEALGGFDDYSESDDDDGVLTYQDNGKPETKAVKEKVTESRKSLAGTSAKQVKVVDPKKDEDSDDESDDDDEEESDDEDESGSPDEMDADSDSDKDESDEDQDDEEETPVKKVDQSKKRPNEPASKTPASAKKAKNATPEKTDGKKNAHTATPHPMKKGGKTPNSTGTDQTPNSGGQLSCKSCDKAFISESGLQQHKKAKHGGQ